MGGCASSPAGVPLSGRRTKPPVAARLDELESHTDANTAVWPPTGALPVLHEVNALQQEVALLGSHPLLALAEAAELLVGRMHLGFAGVAALSSDDPGCALLLTMQGAGAGALERHTVMRGPCWGAVQVAWRRVDRVYVRDAATAAASGRTEDELPGEAEVLYREAGLRSFMAVAIGPQGAPFGALLVARREPGGFDDAWSAVWSSAVTTGLLCHVRPAQVSWAVRALQAVDQTQDPVSAISATLQSGARFMLHATNSRMGVRLALLDPERDTALVFESARARTASCAAAAARAAAAASARAAAAAAARVAGAVPDASAAPGGGAPPSGPLTDSVFGKSVFLPSDPTEDVAVREIPLAHTLLSSALVGRTARFVKDCASYIQNCPTPARDVFTHASHLVSSLVVVPLLVDDRPLGALYFTQDTPCDFSNIQAALLGFVHCFTPALHSKLAGQMDALRSMVVGLGDRNALEAAASVRTSPLIQLTSDSTHSSSTSSDGPAPTTGINPGAAAAASVAGNATMLPLCGTASDSSTPPCATPMLLASARLSKVGSHQLCTEAMLQVLQQEIRKERRRSFELMGCEEELVLEQTLARGGYGLVYRGLWHGTPAAIKVLDARHSNSEAVSDAMEMAVLSNVQHPNIVQVYSCLTDMVPLDDSFDSASTGPCTTHAASALDGGPTSVTEQPALPVARPRFRRLLPGETADVPTYNIVVMEYCDRGTLADAVRAGAFHRRIPGGGRGVDLSAVLDVLLAVARSLSYLHRLSLLHGDVKLDNVLLKSDPLRPLGVVPKLSDFGLTRIVRSGDHAINHRGAGTVTHLAPEMLQPGSLITTAVDSYAFGVTMWEFYTGRRAWSGLAHDTICKVVLLCGRRPSWPAGTPQAFAALASACWADRPEDRPSLPEVVVALQGLAAEAAMPPAGRACTAPTTTAGAAAAPAAPTAPSD